MKTKVLLLAIGCLVGIVGTHAQKGVDTGTPFGSGEDSVRCITNVSLFSSYARSGNLKDAYEFWKIAYDECPAAHKDIYQYGVRIVGWQIENESDPAKKTALMNDLMAVYDKRIVYFGNDPRYGKDWIVSRKIQDYMQRMGEQADAKTVYGWVKEIVDEFGNKTESLAVSYFMFSSHQLLLSDENHKQAYIQDYLKASEILDAQLAEATAANNEKEKSTLLSIKTGIDTGFAGSGAADCETLQHIYGAKVEENKDNLAYLKETVALLRRMRCHETEAYFAASEYAHKQDPTAESAMGLARRAVKLKDFITAIALFEEAAGMETDNIVKAEDYYLIALLTFEQNNYSKARQYCQKALDSNPNYGDPYMLIGTMYAATAPSVYPDDNVLRKSVFYAVVDKFEKAKQVDPSVTEQANKNIRTYREHFPSSEEIFMHPDLEKGKTITIGGWIGERTVVR
ncbi:MAG: tetratricopeptide repeat protein [Tannerellaceae bacterium]|jgi:tetratricopeptide (TPR) repeat protein|nr:tetratricopeptide repeat protein [Tannerellaceae bacterium]